MGSIIYEFQNKLYVNLTNKSATSTAFVERQYTDQINSLESLWLDHEPTMIEVLTELSNWYIAQYKELVFCGYGEPTERMDLVLDIANFVKKRSNIIIRLNTNGLSNLVNGPEIVSKYRDTIDEVSISMVSSTPNSYLTLSQSTYGIDSFQALLDYAAACKDAGCKVIMSTVESTITEEQEAKCRSICEELGVEYVIREYDSRNGDVPLDNSDEIPAEPEASAEPEAPAADEFDSEGETEILNEEEQTPEPAAEPEPEPEPAPAEPEPVEEKAPEAPVEEKKGKKGKKAEAEKEAEPAPAPVVEEVTRPEVAQVKPNASAFEEMETQVRKPVAPKGSRTIKVYLASASKRRNALLSTFGIPFDVIPSNIPESSEGMTPAEAVMDISKAKAQAVADQVPGPCIIIAADTIISLHGEILGKPADENEAFEMLSKLQGDQHRVYTGVTLIIKARAGQKIEQFSDFTKVKMVEMNEKEIKAYIATGEPMDKAGGYAIQGIGCRFIENIEGNYTTVVGMPMHLLYEKLKSIRGVFPG
ncbi:MAG: septum formation protein Maf [Lachnospiraceae bacterium]|nr:septum formation protein Maf [Lachnospiraceae bacterium]